MQRSEKRDILVFGPTWRWTFTIWRARQDYSPLRGSPFGPPSLCDDVLRRLRRLVEPEVLTLPGKRKRPTWRWTFTIWRARQDSNL